MSKEKQNEIKTAADLIQDANNYRKHSDINKARIKKSKYCIKLMFGE